MIVTGCKSSDCYCERSTETWLGSLRTAAAPSISAHLAMSFKPDTLQMLWRCHLEKYQRSPSRLRPNRNACEIARWDVLHRCRITSVLDSAASPSSIVRLNV